MESLLTKVADYLLTQSWQIVIVFVFVAIICWGLRKVSAHWRYLLWLTVLAKCLMPALIYVPLAVMPQEYSSQQTPSLAMSTPVAMPTTEVKPTLVGMNVSEPEIAIEDFEPISTPIMLAHEKDATPASVLEEETISRIDLSFRDWIVIAWFVGMGGFFVYLSLKAWAMCRRLKRSRRIADLEIQAMVSALSEQLQLKITPKIYMATGIAQPFVWGWFRGSIYLPEPFVQSVTREQQQAILTHELAHILRWDAAANLVQIIIQVAFFFHPLIWWTNRQIRREREKCCDEFVIASLVTDPKQYSKAIVSALVAEYESNQSVPSLAIAGRLKNIEDRIQTLLSPQRKFYRRPSWVAVASIMCLTACVVSTTLVLTARGASGDPQTRGSVEQTSPSPSEPDAVAETKEESKASDADTKAWEPGQVLDFQVINAKTKEPLPDVKLELQFHGPGIDFQDIKIQTTDAEGRSKIRLPDRRPDAVRVYPSKAGFVPLRVYWGDDLPSPKLPKSVTIPMELGTVCGGVVQNENGEPIPNVKVCVHYWEKKPEFNPHLRANLCVEDTVRTTDQQGRWQLDIMPATFTGEGPRLFLTHPDYVSDHLQRGHTPMPVTERPSYKALSEQSAVMVMRKGATITGRVTDESGKPISGALISNQYDCYDPDPLKITTTTDEEGNFRLSGLSHRQNYRDHFFAVQADGYTPVFIEVNDHDSAKPVEIKLKPGQIVQGQVADENGKPLEGVSIKLDYWMGRPRQFYLKTTTDANGKFRINDAPLGRTEYDFEKQGYIAVRKPLPPKTEDYQIVLGSPLKIVGSIVDAETNQPLAKCTLTKGWDPDNRAPEWETQLGIPAKTITDGRYEVVINREQWLTRLRVEAEGYMPAVSRLFKPYDPDQGTVTYDFKMKRAGSMSGTVLGLDGKPLADAEVYLAKQQFSVDDGKASPNAKRTSQMAKTNAQGQFKFPPESEPFYLIVLHEQGHIVLDEKQFALTPTVRIEPWRSAKRSLLLQRKQINYSGNAPENEMQALNVRIVDTEGKPVEGANVASSAAFRTGYNYLGENEPAWNYFRNVISDQDGQARVADQYRIDCVVARHVERKLIAIQKISPDQVKSSETVTITLQPQCKVFGKLTAKELEAHNRKLERSNVSVNLESSFARPMSCSSNNADFHFYLPPGTYTLDAHANDTKYVPKAKTITVKPGQKELEVDPINLPPAGLVLLEGKPAPELRDIVAWKNGGPVKLSDLKGKIVILAFSPRWIADRPHEWMPNLFTVYDKYHDQGLAIIDIRLDQGIGINSQAKLDEKIAELKSPFWDDRDLPIPIALGFLNKPSFLISEEEKKTNGYVPCAILKDYGTANFPAAVLIDRQGKIVGKFDLFSDRDNAMLEKMLKEK